MVPILGNVFIMAVTLGLLYATVHLKKPDKVQ